MAASNPSRTATEHLRSGCCKNFKEKHGDIVAAHAALTNPPDPPASTRKRVPTHLAYPPPGADISTSTKREPDAQQTLQSNLKKVRQSEGSAAGHPVSGRMVGRLQVDASMAALCDFLYEACSSIPAAAFDHPQLRRALTLLGAAAPPRLDITGARLDARYEEVRGASLAKLRSSASFQLASDGWAAAVRAGEGSTRLINIMVNLPSGSTLFQKVVSLEGPSVTDASLEETLQAAVNELPNGQSRSCLGVVTDADAALKPGLLGYFDATPAARDCLAHAMTTQLQRILPLRLPPEVECNGVASVGMMQDMQAASKAFQAVLLDPVMRQLMAPGSPTLEMCTTLSNLQLWGDLDSTLNLLLPIRDIVLALQADRPTLSQCLPLWNVIREQAERWGQTCAEDKQIALEVVEKRFQANYHKAWAASYVLDPLYLLPASSNDRWVPPSEKMTAEQQADAETIIKRLAPTDALRAQALVEFTRFRFEGVDPEYARAVQLRQRNPRTNQEEVPNSQVRRVLWESHLAGYTVLSQAAIRLMSLHATACGPRRDGTRWALLHKGASQITRDRAHKMLLIASQGMLDRKDFLDPWDRHYVEDCSEALCQAARFARGKAAILLGGSALLSAGGALQSAGQIAAATGCHLICENAFARLDRGRHLPCPERLAYFPQEAAAQLRKYTLILVIGMKRPIAMFGYRNGPSELLSLPDEAVWEFDNDSASPATLLKMLASSVASRQPWPAKYMDAVAQQPAKAPQAPSGKLTAQAMCTLVAQSQPEGTIMVDESLTSGTAYWEAAKVAASFSHLTLTGGAIGSGPPLALGAAIACPGQTVINLQADGSAMYSLQALWSQARENLKIITIICANQEYAILKVEMARQQALPTLQPGVAAQSRPSRLLTDIGTPRINWVSLAQGMGLQLATRATSCEEFREQMAAALAHDGPSLIEAVLK
ncbi:hypothetical protein WJX84_001863 [Apatococcus fuscideae]|uniref:Thiamine pyrophosphate enzyme TPP-binding domain-containing protein n=1 Tax=Apatococcus fuscideae TaxID=2026836 RepID=A0AAW1SXC4_9CHLO